MEDCMPDLYLHIGMPKAGSTSIQQYLSTLDVSPLAHAPDLLVCLDDPAATRAYRKRWNAKHRDAVFDELGRWTGDRAVLSTEFLYDYVTAGNIENLAVELFAHFDQVRVIVYLRDQAEHFRSLVGQRIRSGQSDWKTILTVPDSLYRYDEVCELWGGHFDLTVRSYEDCRSGLVADFAEWAGLPEPAPSERQNTSLCYEALDILVRVNAITAPSKERERRALAKRLEEMDGRPYRLPGDMGDRIRETYAAANERVRERWINKPPATSDSLPSKAGPRQSPNRTVAA